jgi:hypothetical protein
MCAATSLTPRGGPIGTCLKMPPAAWAPARGRDCLGLQSVGRGGDGNAPGQDLKAWQGSLGVSELRGITSPDYVVFCPLHREYPRLLHFLLRNQLLRTIYLSMSNGIRTIQWRLEPERFLDLPVLLPPLDEQREIVAHIDAESTKVESLRVATDRTIRFLKECRAALKDNTAPDRLDFIMEYWRKK